MSFAALTIALTQGAGVHAQSTTPDPPPPVVQNVDANGVDLTSGLLAFSAQQVSIGPAKGGLARIKENFQVEDNYYGAINSSGSTYTVSLGDGSESFTLSGGVYTSNQQSGSTLSFNATAGQYKYTLSDGSTAFYSSTASFDVTVSANVAIISSYSKPTGETLNYDYFVQIWNTGPPQEPIPNKREYIASVTSNRGLMIKYSYQSSGPSGALFPLIAVQGINNAVDYCAPGGSGACANTSQTWPSVSFSGTSATDPLNRTTNYGAPAASSTQTISRPAGDYMSYTYDGSSRVTSVTNGVGTWTYGYSTSGSTLTVTIKDPNSNTRTVTANTATREIITDKDPLGRTTGYAYDSAMRLVSITRPHGDVTTYTYDENETSPRGDVTTTTWTPAGGGSAIVTHASFDSSCTSAAKCNKPNTTTDGRGAVTTYTYDNATGVLLTVTKPAMSVGSNPVQPQTRYSYAWVSANVKTASGSLAAESAGVYLLTDVSTCNTTAACIGTADETHIHITYDANHNLAPASVTTYAGDGSISSSRSFSYDAFGNLATSTSPLGATTTYVYDADRELTGVIGPDPDGAGSLTPAAAQLGYDGDGRVALTRTGAVNSQGDTGFSSFTLNTYQTTGYDGVGRVAQVTSDLVSNGAVGSPFAVTQYSYDAANNLQCTAVRMNMAVTASLPGACSQSAAGIDGADQITYRAYNADNSLFLTVSGWGASSSHYGVVNYYNSDGTLGVMGDGKGDNTCYYYDGFGRVVTVQYPTASNGGTCNGNDINTYSYDADGNMTAKGLRGGGVLTYTYDADGDMTKGGDGAVYGYDLQGRLTDPNNGSWGVHISYDALGRKTQEYNSFGGAVYSSYDAAGDRTRLTWQGGQYVSYGYDLLGRMTSIGENGATSGVGLLASYVYDSFGRKTNAFYGGGSPGALSQGFLYGGDSRSSITGYVFNGDGSKNLQSWLTYNAAGGVKIKYLTNNLYDWSGGYNAIIGYGINGLNQIATNGASFTYDGPGSLSLDGSHTYGYTPLEQLSSFQGSGANATLSYDALHRLTQTQSPSATTRFVYDGSAPSEELDTSGDVLARYVPGPDGSPMLWYNGPGTGDRRWLLKDQQGSVIAVGNSSGQSLATNTYDAYGLPGSSNLGRFQYDGYPFVPEVGLYNTGARSYSPTLGRFLQTDPIGYGDGMNWYAYTHGDPVNGTDPSGLMDEVVVTGPPRGDSEYNQSDQQAYEQQTHQNVSQAETNPGYSNSDGGGRQRSLAPQATTVSEVVVTAKRMQVAAIPPEDEEAAQLGEGAASVRAVESEVETGARLLGRSLAGFKNTLHHIFDEPGHNLDGFLAGFSSQTEAYTAVQNAVSSNYYSGSGSFSYNINVNGTALTVTGGYLSDGSPQVKDFYIPR